MKSLIPITLFVVTVLLVTMIYATTAFADSNSVTLTGAVYDLGKNDKYEISKAKATSIVANGFYLKGDFSTDYAVNGFTKCYVRSDGLDILINQRLWSKLFNQSVPTEWHIITDKTKTVDSTVLPQSINSGAIIVQTSKDGKLWINSDYETDFFTKIDSMNHRSSSSNVIDSFYRPTHIQLTNGCYYRIIVAYKLQREVEPAKLLFATVKQTEEKERIEIYQFYACDSTVSREETLDKTKAYEFCDVYRVDNQNGFSNPILIKSDDPHIDWTIGKFYVSGYTDVLMDNEIPVFLKVPGDRAALWFNLEQELDKCNGSTDIKVNYISSGSDIYFQTPEIKNFGRGTLIVRKTSKGNKKERQIYTNYLEASATVGVNTRVDLFEEGDYEVALDYQLHYDKPFVFNTTALKTLTYRIFFKFKVRNGDISAFLRDIDTNQFITNANVAEHGFYIDVANSQYLKMTIKREVLTDSLDGLKEDTKFSGIAKEGRQYTDEGIYTVTIKNLATDMSEEKRVYVGNRDLLMAHMKTGLTISEINERLASGASIDTSGKIIDPEPTPIIEISQDTTSTHVESPSATISEEQNKSSDTVSVSMPSGGLIPTTIINTAQTEGEQAQNNFTTIVIIIAIVAALIASAGFTIKIRTNKKEKETKRGKRE